MKTMSKLKLEDFIPMKRIEDRVGESLRASIRKDTQVLDEDPRSYGQALHFSGLQLIAAGKIPFIPQELEPIQGTKEFSIRLKNHIFMKTKMKLPTSQISIELRDPSGFKVCGLHMAEAVYNQWNISDIILQDKSKRLGENGMSADYAGLGDGIFDEIMSLIESSARKSAAGGLCLLAFKEAHRKAFEKRGFHIMTRKQMPQAAIDMAEEHKTGYPMFKKL